MKLSATLSKEKIFELITATEEFEKYFESGKFIKPSLDEEPKYQLWELNDNLTHVKTFRAQLQFLFSYTYLCDEFEIFMRKERVDFSLPTEQFEDEEKQAAFDKHWKMVMDAKRERYPDGIKDVFYECWDIMHIMNRYDNYIEILKNEISSFEKRTGLKSKNDLREATTRIEKFYSKEDIQKRAAVELILKAGVGILYTDNKTAMAEVAGRLTGFSTSSRAKFYDTKSEEVYQLSISKLYEMIHSIEQQMKELYPHDL